ncbi:MAG: helix-turn-helix domain-containing protein [Chryseobacterium sp.]|jgi:YesN/AraC family two-component response regulator|uniref:helix-turn-helix domain-containing protein n=1 Tax=Chryseobacterium sp. TaxID=1871047 RepID=UPI0028295814|nr:helix-turn-helix domain-containing protein [Chryseobacterium sp.]MDR2235394.1 helix-turn-helix domain-containing protein [Chryseobacterium sp.]
MAKFYCFIFFLLFLHPVFIPAQNNLPTKQEIKKLYDAMDDSTTDQQIGKIEKIINLSKKIDYKEGVGIGNVKLMYIYYHRSDYKKAMELIKETEALDLDNNRILATMYFHKSFVNKAMGIEKEELQNIKDGLKYAKKIEEPSERHILTSALYNRFSIFYDYKKPDSLIYYLKKELEELQQINDGDQEYRAKKHEKIALNNLNIGNFYLGVIQPQRLDLAEPHYLEAYNYKTTQPEIFEKLDMPILCGTGRFYLEKHDYKKSIELANEVVRREKYKKNPTYRLYAYMLLADSNEELKNPSEQARYTLLYAKLKDSLNNAAKKEVGQQVDRLVTAAEAKKDKEYTSNFRIFLFIAGGFIILLALSIWLYWKRKNKTLHWKYEALISKISNEQNDIQEESGKTRDNTESKTSVNITDETAKALLAKLEKFEQSEKYLRKDISLTWMASQFNTNTKYLSELIKTYRDKNFTTYINGLRIGYITKKLYENPIYREYKINYLAEECGYVTPQVFVTAFKKETGFTPSYFLEQLKVSV